MWELPWEKRCFTLQQNLLPTESQRALLVAILLKHIKRSVRGWAPWSWSDWNSRTSGTSRIETSCRKVWLRKSGLCSDVVLELLAGVSDFFFTKEHRVELKCETDFCCAWSIWVIKLLFQTHHTFVWKLRLRMLHLGGYIAKWDYRHFK